MELVAVYSESSLRLEGLGHLDAVGDVLVYLGWSFGYNHPVCAVPIPPPFHVVFRLARGAIRWLLCLWL